jgi:multidrug efflux pump subunit AcrA (membrane-fusion protein)
MRSHLISTLTIALVAAAAGCQQSSSGSPATGAAEQPARPVAVVRPQRQTVRRAVGQPGFTQAFERTPIVSKIAGYVLKWNVDLGAPVKKGEVLAELSIPEMLSQLKLKTEQVEQAHKVLAMAQAQVATGQAQVKEAEAGAARAESNHQYWKSQSERMTNLAKNKVVDQQAQEETLNQFHSAASALIEARAKVAAAAATVKEKEASRAKAEVDIRVAEADRQREADLVAYARLTAPFDGVVTQRSIDTGQFVQPAGTGAAGDTLFVVERTDVIRVFVSVPEADADWVKVGIPAVVRVQALQGREFKGKVARTAWSLNSTTRTLLTEIDLPNPDRQLRPGMYAYATLDAAWPDVLTLPASAVATQGDVNVGFQTFCFLVEQGRAKRTPVEVGVRNEQLVEVVKKQVGGPGGQPRWEAFTGSEEVVQGSLSGLKDGQAVAPSAGKSSPPR